MSMRGFRPAELAAQERERLRLDQVRRECEALASACEETLAGVRDVAVQQLAAPALRDVRAAIDQARQRAAAQPDQAHTDLRKAQQTLHQTLVEAAAGARAWSAEQKRARADLAAARAATQALQQVAGPASAPVLAEAAAAADAAGRALDAGRIQEARAAVERITAQVDAGRQADLDETIRRTLVRSLFDTLRAQGFETSDPRLLADGTPGGKVTLVGQLPSGRSARFDIFLDGRLGFDMDGYEGRACARELEAVEQKLRDRFGIRLGPPQVEWKNPDKISQGARDLPSGGRSGGHGGGHG